MQKLSFFCLLILILGFVFVAPAAMAEFGGSMSLRSSRADRSSADGNQVDAGGIAQIRVKFDKVVAIGSTDDDPQNDLNTGDFEVRAYNRLGGLASSPTISLAADPLQNDGKNYIATIDGPNANVARIVLSLPKHKVFLADLGAELKDDGKRKPAGKNDRFSIEVFYVQPDMGVPRVYSIQRNDGSLLPVTAETVNVVITLSEAAAELTKDHIAVENAVAADPVKVTSVPVDSGARARLERAYAEGAGNPIEKPSNVDGETGFDESYTVSDSDEADLQYIYMQYEQAVGGAQSQTSVVGNGPPELPTSFTDPDTPELTPLTEPAADDLDTVKEAYNEAVSRSIEQLTYNSQLAAFNDELADAQRAANDAYQRALRDYNNAVWQYYWANAEAIVALVGNISLGATGRDNMLARYVVTLTPNYESKNAIVVKVKSFEDMVLPFANDYFPPSQDSLYLEGVDKLTIAVGSESGLKAKELGVKFALPKDKVIPAGGYLVVAEDKAGSSVHVPDGDIDKSPAPHQRDAKELLYNVIDDGDLPNLQGHLSNGGIIDVTGPHALVITEIMWGIDKSLDDPTKSQWIELYNAGDEYKTQDGDNTTYLVFYDGTDTLPDASTVKDRMGTTDSTGITWPLTGKGDEGRTAEQVAGAAQVVETEPLISMYRLITAGTVANGRLSGSWMQSVAPSTNFESNRLGVHIGTPGAATVQSVAERLAAEAAAKAAADASTAAAAAAAAALEGTGTIPVNGNIYISEIMVDRGANLPQWIEIANGSRTEEVNLSGWTLTVDNATADADVSVGASITFTIPAGTKIGMFGQQVEPSTLLVVTEAGRTSLAGTLAKGQVLNLWESNQDELILGGVTKRRYSLLSEEAFLITLAPPAPVKTVVAATATPTEKAAARAADTRATLRHTAASDVIGNLGADGAAAWALPMNAEGGRSSIIRRHIPITRGPAAPQEGDVREGWALASETSFAQPTHVRAASYYGAANDIGTPGFRAGGALPVELSHFRPARDKVTDAVVITWATQSELNNAGFFIKRSNQANGEFKVVNATIIPGAGTTSEKQFYTYTDTTASPNTVYYYQIEDVSLDGNRQTLTRGIRLKGHVGVAGKATVIWGELKDRD